MYLEITKCFSTQCATSKLIHLQNSPGLKTFPSNLIMNALFFLEEDLKTILCIKLSFFLFYVIFVFNDVPYK